MDKATKSISCGDQT